jgi:hypothetical protein
MNQRLVYIAGSVAAAALFIFAVWHATQRKPQQRSAAPTLPLTETQDAEHAAVPRIEQGDLYAHFKAGDVTIIDVRDGGAFAASHIPGALHIPLARIDAEAPSLPKGKPIVTYCT